MVSFVNPDVLGNLTTFRRVFETPIEKSKTSHGKGLSLHTSIYSLGYIQVGMLKQVTATKPLASKGV